MTGRLSETLKFSTPFVVITCLIATTWRASNAQQLSGYAGAFADVPISARTAGVGYARTAVVTAAEAMFSNPAALTHTSFTQVAFSYFRLYGLVPNLAATAAKRLNDRTGLGFAVVSSGDRLYRENTVHLGGSRILSWFGRQLDTGVKISLRYGSFGKEAETPGAVTGSVWGLGLTLGSRFWLTDHAVLALNVQDLLNTLRWSSSASGSYSEGLPVSFTLGAGVLDVRGITMEVDWAKSLYRETRDRVCIGIERRVFSYASIRAGYGWTTAGPEDEHTTLGIGINYPLGIGREFSLDVAYSLEDLPNTLRFTMGLGF